MALVCWPIYLVSVLIFIIYICLSLPNGIEKFTLTPDNINEVTLRAESHDLVLPQNERLDVLQQKIDQSLDLLNLSDKPPHLLNIDEMELILRKQLGNEDYNIVYFGESKEDDTFDIVLQKTEYYLALYIQVPKETWKPTIKGYIFDDQVNSVSGVMSFVPLSDFDKPF